MVFGEHRLFPSDSEHNEREDLNKEAH